MGNTISGERENTKLTTTVATRTQLRSIFRKAAKDSFSNIELISISKFLFGSVKGLNETISYELLLAKLHLECLLDDEKGDMLFKLLKNLRNWPCVSENDIEGDFSLQDIITIIYILNSNGFGKLGLDYYEYFAKLVFMLITIEPEVDNSENNEKIDIILNKDKQIKWSLLPIIQSFDGLDFEGINKAKLQKFLELLLPLSIFKLNSKSFELNYSTQIKSIITTLYLNIEDENEFNFRVFLNNFKNYTPNLFKSLNNLLASVLIDDEKDIIEETKLDYKVLNYQLLSQLSTIVDVLGLNLTLNSKPLFQGSKHGYSINSIQSHTLNYNASTLLLISGKTIDKKKVENNSFFHKFPKFHPIYESKMRITEKGKFTIGILITKPWRITNTKNFGSKDFKIIQLNPFQIVLDAENSIKDNYAYFSNIGLGIGFGSKPPSKSKDIKNNYINFTSIGGCSITIDNSLEIGNFRIEDMSNMNSTYGTKRTNNEPAIYNDIWFKISEIEIYGLGDVQSLEDQQRALEWEEREAERRRGLNKDYAEGKALLELAGIIGGSSSGGSV